eukprot:SAG11_NODE_1264_length_5353_cov_3.799391_2_plen_140_part_01
MAAAAAAAKLKAAAEAVEARRQARLQAEEEAARSLAAATESLSGLFGELGDGDAPAPAPAALGEAAPTAADANSGREARSSTLRAGGAEAIKWPFAQPPVSRKTAVAERPERGTVLSEPTRRDEAALAATGIAKTLVVAT